VQKKKTKIKKGKTTKKKNGYKSHQKRVTLNAKDKRLATGGLCYN